MSTHDLPDLRYRTDDVGRGFLYAPVFSPETKRPPVHTGPRATTHLSRRAVRQIKGAALKAAKHGVGMRSMITFTVRPEDRVDVESGELVLGREIRRVINALNMWFKRRGMPGLLYIWVAENPANDNPHVHLLTNHRVPHKEFQAFCAHIESLWGHGFAHVEAIRNPADAGRYLLKAVAYLTKGAGLTQGQVGLDGTTSLQGVVIGNRYGIASAILPRYETIDLYDCEEAADELRDLQRLFGGEIKEWAPGIFLTQHGLAFTEDEDLSGVREVIDRLTTGGECVSEGFN